jgi:NACalpha-BTF3-like transcription factor
MKDAQLKRSRLPMASDTMDSSEITGAKIKAVRKQTRAGTLDCRKALEATGGDVDRAIEYLREHGIGTPKNPRWAHGDYAT